MSLLSKTLNSGMKAIGNGQQNRTLGRKHLSFRKHSANAGKRTVELHKRPTADFRKSELGFDIFFADGHTDKQMIPHINYKDKTIVFCADLLATAGHIPVPYVMGYDTSYTDDARKQNS
jgi:glyoxylase-like metal-dependent hydrolase (beta-lactamase superfamily II)